MLNYVTSVYLSASVLKISDGTACGSSICFFFKLFLLSNDARGGQQPSNATVHHIDYSHYKWWTGHLPCHLSETKVTIKSLHLLY